MVKNADFDNRIARSIHGARGAVDVEKKAEISKEKLCYFPPFHQHLQLHPILLLYLSAALYFHSFFQNNQLYHYKLYPRIIDICDEYVLVEVKEGICEWKKMSDCEL